MSNFTTTELETYTSGAVFVAVQIAKAFGPPYTQADLNGNGTVDSGRELFGDSTVLTRGPKAGQKAANGFEALADLDAGATGNADGLINSQDGAYTQLRIWQDANQNGISESSELHTLGELGIASSKVTDATSNENLSGVTNDCVVGKLLLARKAYLNAIDSRAAYIDRIVDTGRFFCKTRCLMERRAISASARRCAGRRVAA